jgi:acylphosphatase
MTNEYIIEVRGRVQGIGFRADVKSFADKHNIYGLVKNIEDGSVSICAQSKKENIDYLIEWLEKSPGLSKVEKIIINPKEVKIKYNDFQIKRNGSFFKDKMRSIYSLLKGVFVR